MRTVQMTLDEHLVQTVDKVVKNMHMTRSAFTRKALQQAIERIKTESLEEKHRQGYLRKPVTADEFGVWAKEQKWGDE
ncbi:MAG: CopG family transcriptional regulator [Lentisphaerae bacterium RIFOXYA12_FULL_48_11]|nr:MAG: CopG family transcriptional regulator [Lentisphaerae bacterium RIFOXYA12_FULL_48_11]